MTTECLAAARTLPATVGNEVLDAGLAEDVAAQFDDSVADVRVADGADGEFLNEEISQ